MLPVFHEYGRDRNLGAITSLGAAFKVRTNGIVYPDVGSAQYIGVMNFAGRAARSAGLLIRQPEPDDYTPYRITCDASAAQNVSIVVQMGIAPAVPTGNLNGQPIIYPVIVATQNESLSFDRIVALPNPKLLRGTQYRNRATMVGVTFVNNPNSARDVAFSYRLTVERMVSQSPPFYDRRIG